MSKPSAVFKKNLQKLSHRLEVSQFLRFVDESTSPQKFFYKNHSTFIFEAGEREIRVRSLEIASWLLENRFQDLSAKKKELEQHAYSIGNKVELDNLHFKHILDQLHTLLEDSKLQKQVLQIKKPLVHPKMDALIRLSIQKPKGSISDLDIQILCLSAFLTPLRQSVGSCFATAPAILVQKEQPSLFFQDLEDLLHMRVLKRVFSGNEFSIPISPSFGLGSIDRSFTFTQRHCPSYSLELFAVFEFLKLVNPKDNLETRQEKIQKILKTELNLAEGQTTSFEKIIRKLLLHKYDLTEEKVARAALEAPSVSSSEYYVQSTQTYDRFYQELEDTQDFFVQWTNHPLLRCWEYTVASFAESKSDFYKWNLYTSLGFDPKEEDGLGQEIVKYLEEKFTQNNEEIDRLNQEYEQEFFRVKSLEKRVRDTESEHMSMWARVEYQNHINEMNRHLKARDDLIYKTEKLSGLLPKLIQVFIDCFPKHFQELYDAKMQDYSASVYEDSPAGFRLIFKHGREDPSLWSFIMNSAQFSQSLKEFFVLSEHEILNHETLQGFKVELQEIATVIIHFVQSEEFIEGAFKRVCKRYQVQFPKDKQVDKLAFKPWSYVSGGTLKGLMSNYFKNDSLFEEHQKKVISPTELFAFLIETIRLFPEKKLQMYQKNKEASLLMYSPNHAFIFKPGWLPLEQIWDKNIYPYTWIRDEVVIPRAQQKAEVWPKQVISFIDYFTRDNPYLCVWLKENILWPNYKLSLLEFRALLFKHLHKIPHQITTNRIHEDLIDSWIYEFFPLVEVQDLEKALQRCLTEIFNEKELLEKVKPATNRVLDSLQLSPYICSPQLYDILSSIVILIDEKKHFAQDYATLILEAMRKHHYAQPKPLFFADTNWPYYHFAFVVNPASLELELWRVDPSGKRGFPMSIWNHFFQENNPSVWGIFSNEAQYTFRSKKMISNLV